MVQQHALLDPWTLKVALSAGQPHVYLWAATSVVMRCRFCLSALGSA